LRRSNSSRERERDEIRGKRKQQQKASDQSLHVLLCESEPQGCPSIVQNPKLAQALRIPLRTKYARCRQMDERSQALPFILAHHQRTPTNRNRQSLKNPGG